MEHNKSKHQKRIRLKLVIFLTVSLGITVFLSLFLIIKKQKGDFTSYILKCHAIDPKLRFSCYRSGIEKYYNSNLKDLTKKLADSQFSTKLLKNKGNSEVSYAIFGTNCHTFYHALGDFIAENATEPDVASKLNYCPSECTSGCTMGLYKRLALKNNFSSSLLKEFYDVCREGENHQCAHEIGHLLQDKYFYSVLKTLDETSYNEFGFKTGLKYNYISFSKTDFNAPFEECKKILPENELPYCFTGIGHNLFLFSAFSKDGYKSMFEECNSVKAENKDNCLAFLIYRIGINEAGPRFLSKKFAEGRKVCDEAVNLIKRPDLKHHCYLGVGGGIGLFVDTEYLSAPIPENLIEKIRGELREYAKMCEKSEEKYIDKCLAGILGTRFKLIYKLLRLDYDRIERLLPEIDDNFEVVG